MREQLTSVGIDIGASPPQAAWQPGGPFPGLHILGANELPLRKISAKLRFYGLTPAPLRGDPVVEVPE